MLEMQRGASQVYQKTMIQLLKENTLITKLQDSSVMNLYIPVLKTIGALKPNSAYKMHACKAVCKNMHTILVLLQQYAGLKKFAVVEYWLCYNHIMDLSISIIT